MEKKDAYSPNGVALATGIAVLTFVILSGTTLWIPASRLQNLHLRSIALSFSEAASAVSTMARLDRPLPYLRSGFLEATGLSAHPSWDERYYNKRSNYADSNKHPAADPAASPDSVLRTATGRQDLSVPIAPEGSVIDTASTGALPAGFLPAEPRFNMVHSSENPLKVYMFGDSQVFSLGSGLSRLAGKDSPVSVEFLAIHSSGFVRWDYYSWPDKLDDYFSSNPCDAAVMMLGMNDYQSFWNSRGEIMKKGTPEWEAAYREKCGRIIDRVLMSVPRIYWVSMPLVKNSEYNETLEYIDKVQDDICESWSPDLVVRIRLRDAIPGTGKPYTDFLTSPLGNQVRVMSEDGSHFTVEGGQIAMKPLFDRLARDYLFSEVPVAKFPD